MGITSTLRFSSTATYLVIATILSIAIVALPIETLLIGFVSLSLIALAILHPLSALTMMLVVAPLRALLAAHSEVNLPLDIGQFAFIAMLGVVAMYRMANRESLLTVRWTPLFITLAVFILVTGLSLATSLSVSLWLSEWLKWLALATTALIAIGLAARYNWQWLIFALVVAGIPNAFIGIYIFLGGSGADHFAINDRFFRAFGTFEQPNPFGGFMGINAALAIAMAAGYGLSWYEHRNTQSRQLTFMFFVFYTTIAGLLTLGVLISWSRGSWLALTAAVGIMTLFVLKRWRVRLLFVSLALIGGFFVFSAGLLPDAIGERLSSAFAEYFTLTDVRGVDVTPENYAVVERLGHWQAALNMAQANPWLGVGLGNFDAAYSEYRLLNWPQPLGHAHNFYLNILAETGIIGALSYICLWIAILWMTMRAMGHPDSLTRLTSIGLMGVWVYIAVHSLLDNLFVNNVFLHIGVMLGLLHTLYARAATQTRVSVNELPGHKGQYGD